MFRASNGIMPADAMTLLTADRPDTERESEFREIVRNFSPPIYRYASSFLGDSEEASEALQEILLNVYRSLPDLRDEPSLATRVYRIALRTLFSYRRSCGAGALPVISPEEAQCIVDESADLEEMYAREETRERLERCIAKLPPRESTAITLFYMDGLGYKEIASIMATSLGGVGLLLHRGRERLGALLREEPVA